MYPAGFDFLSAGVDAGLEIAVRVAGHHRQDDGVISDRAAGRHAGVRGGHAVRQHFQSAGAGDLRIFEIRVILRLEDRHAHIGSAARVGDLHARPVDLGSVMARADDRVRPGRGISRVQVGLYLHGGGRDGCILYGNGLLRMVDGYDDVGRDIDHGDGEDRGLHLRVRMGDAVGRCLNGAGSDDASASGDARVGLRKVQGHSRVHAYGDDGRLHAAGCRRHDRLRVGRIIICDRERADVPCPARLCERLVSALRVGKAHQDAHGSDAHADVVDLHFRKGGTAARDLHAAGLQAAGGKGGTVRGVCGRDGRADRHGDAADAGREHVGLRHRIARAAEGDVPAGGDRTAILVLIRSAERVCAFRRRIVLYHNDLHGSRSGIDAVVRIDFRFLLEQQDRDRDRHVDGDAAARAAVDRRIGAAAAVRADIQPCGPGQCQVRGLFTLLRAARCYCSTGQERLVLALIQCQGKVDADRNGSARAGDREHRRLRIVRHIRRSGVDREARRLHRGAGDIHEGVVLAADQADRDRRAGRDSAAGDRCRDYVRLAGEDRLDPRGAGQRDRHLLQGSDVPDGADAHGNEAVDRDRAAADANADDQGVTVRDRSHVQCFRGDLSDISGYRFAGLRSHIGDGVQLVDRDRYGRADGHRASGDGDHDGFRLGLEVMAGCHGRLR